jgi:hypothetical protein
VTLKKWVSKTSLLFFKKKYIFLKSYNTNFVRPRLQNPKPKNRSVNKVSLKKDQNKASKLDELTNFIHKILKLEKRNNETFTLKKITKKNQSQTNLPIPSVQRL